MASHVGAFINREDRRIGESWHKRNATSRRLPFLLDIIQTVAAQLTDCPIHKVAAQYDILGIVMKHRVASL